MAIPISVVIITYNHADHIGAAVDSVLAQSYTEFEIVVIDDGSTDQTPEVMAGYGDRVRYLRQVNQGRGAARNSGITAASHEWIAFLDSDDLWETDKLAKQVAAVGKYPEIDVLVTNACWFNENEIVKPDYFRTMTLLWRQSVKRNGTLAVFAESAYPLFLDENFVNLSSVMVRKSALVAAGMFDASLQRCQDRDLWLRMAREYRFAFIDEILVRSRQHSLHDGPQTDVPLVSRIQLFEKALKADTEWEQRYSSRLRRRIGHSYFNLGRFQFFVHNDFERARVNLDLGRRYGYHSLTGLLLYLASFLPVDLVKSLRRLKHRLAG